MSTQRVVYGAENGWCICPTQWLGEMPHSASIRHILPEQLTPIHIGVMVPSMLRLGWPSLLLLVFLVVLLARRPGLLASRAFVPALLVAGALLLVGYRRRRPPR